MPIFPPAAGDRGPRVATFWPHFRANAPDPGQARPADGDSRLGYEAAKAMLRDALGKNACSSFKRLPATTGRHCGLADLSRPIEQTATLGERRAVGEGATFALPGDVLTARTRDGVDDHVSWQQPVTASTALGRSVHPARTADQVANISCHAHHIGISNFSNPGRCVNRYDSLSSSRRVVVASLTDQHSKARTGQMRAG